MGWVYTTSEELARIERDTPTKRELAQRVSAALTGPKGSDLLQEALRKRRERLEE